MSATYGFVKLHPELKTGTPKNLDINRLVVSCRSVLKPWYITLDELHEKFHYNPALMINVDESSTRFPADSKQLVVHTADTKADPAIWREFQKQLVDVSTFVPHSTHLNQPLDRVVFAVFKSELTNKFEAPSSSSSSSKRSAISDVLPQAIHTVLCPSVIQKAFICSGVLHNSSGPVLLKLPESSIYPLPSRRNGYNFDGKVITDENLLEKWENHLKMNIERKNEMDEKEKDEVKTVVDEKKKKKKKISSCEKR
ncbi:uncharacterized protein MONOS_8195 [Monocercomonoides exilis]|uniref:uncharacterized protein n=1 Tax=Monocercomonoides exilis TaxID=2049356 RepID=UPI00355AAD84|nr:hypothetical protein MONOS_8195 [Monocercomonoides exilis]